MLEKKNFDYLKQSESKSRLISLMHSLSQSVYICHVIHASEIPVKKWAKNRGLTAVLLSVEWVEKCIPFPGYHGAYELEDKNFWANYCK